jgi:hypothetical protein
MWVRIGPIGGYGNQSLGSTKGGEFVDQLSEHQLLKRYVVRQLGMNMSAVFLHFAVKRNNTDNKFISVQFYTLFCLLPIIVSDEGRDIATSHTIRDVNGWGKITYLIP